MAALKGLGGALKRLRLQRGFTAAEAARRTGIDQSNLGKYERGEFSLTVATLDRVLDAYQANAAEFAQALDEEQRGAPICWVLPGRLSAEDLEQVVRAVLVEALARGLLGESVENLRRS